MSKFCKTITNDKYLPPKVQNKVNIRAAKVIQKKVRENIDKTRKRTLNKLNKDAPPQNLESTTSVQNPSNIQTDNLTRSTSGPPSQNGGGFYSAVGEGAIAGMPIYKGYFDMTPPIFKGELLRSTLQDVSCGPQASSQSGGKKRRRTRKRKLNKRKRRTKNKRKSKKNRRYKKRSSKRTYRK